MAELLTKERQFGIPWLSISCLYAFTGLWGIVQVVNPYNTALYLLFAVAIVFSATTWAVIDARRAGRPLLHIIQLLMFLTWPIALPAYLIWSRHLRGCCLALFHAVALTIINMSVFLCHYPDTIRP